MKKVIVILMLFSVNLSYAGVPHTFHANQPAVAAEVNANFNYLNSEIGDVNSKVNENTSDIQENTNDISILDTAISSLSTSLLWLEGVVNAAVDAIADLTDRVNVLENQSGGNQSNQHCDENWSDYITYNHIPLPVGTIFSYTISDDLEYDFVIVKVPFYDTATSKKYVITYPAFYLGFSGTAFLGLSSSTGTAFLGLSSSNRNEFFTQCNLALINGFKVSGGVRTHIGFGHDDYEYHDHDHNDFENLYFYRVVVAGVRIALNEKTSIFIYTPDLNYSSFIDFESSDFDFTDIDISEVYSGVNHQQIFEKYNEFINYIYIEEVQP